MRCPECDSPELTSVRAGWSTGADEERHPEGHPDTRRYNRCLICGAHWTEEPPDHNFLWTGIVVDED